MSVSRYLVSSFLKEFNNHLEKENFLPVKRKDGKTIQTLIKLGLNFTNLPEELATLTIEDYSSGPEPNEDYPGYVMVFGKNICGREIYIKITNTDRSGVTRMAVCISFHDADYSLAHPFK